MSRIFEHLTDQEIIDLFIEEFRRLLSASKIDTLTRNYSVICAKLEAKDE